MSIQQYAHCTLCNCPMPVEDDRQSSLPTYVTYADHVVAMSNCFTEGMLSERDRIRQAVKTLTVDPSQGWYAQSVLDIIDGRAK